MAVKSIPWLTMRYSKTVFLNLRNFKMTPHYVGESWKLKSTYLVNKVEKHCSKDRDMTSVHQNVHLLTSKNLEKNNISKKTGMTSFYVVLG